MVFLDFGFCFVGADVFACLGFGDGRIKLYLDSGSVEISLFHLNLCFLAESMFELIWVMCVESYSVIGFFMRFEDDSLESAKTVKQWNVKIISISKNKRHQDRTAALEVWDRLEEFVRSRSHS